MGESDPEQDRSSLRCFVIGPIGNRLAAVGTPERVTYEESLRVMEEVIEPACAQVCLVPVRADGLTRAGEITDQIFHRLRDDDVVIADLTGANPNVMYELGLRHTRDKLTVQVGEFGRLPFDVNTIRTIQFSRSPVGLINARDELIQVLESGLAGGYDQVTATRIWADPTLPAEEERPSDTSDDPAELEAEDDADQRGFIDIMADAEEQQDELVPALEAVGQCVVELGQLAEESAAQIARGDAAGKGMRGRLQVAARHAAGLDAIADRLEQAVEHYASVLSGVSAGSLALIARMEEDEDDLESGRDFGLATRHVAKITRESMAGFAGMVESINENARMAKVLQKPSRRLTRALQRFAEATSIVDEWDRRMQALGIPQPPDDWEPELDDDDPDLGARETSSDDDEGAPGSTDESDPPQGKDE
ncbi:MAG TPA: hypothetical protein VGR11_02510 [Solirubrobacteraceae bacterium]|nr:hypothetical protein [Solirubrobacteraceae bacterium]